MNREQAEALIVVIERLDRHVARRIRGIQRGAERERGGGLIQCDEKRTARDLHDVIDDDFNLLWNAVAAAPAAASVLLRGADDGKRQDQHTDDCDQRSECAHKSTGSHTSLLGVGCRGLVDVGRERFQRCAIESDQSQITN